MIAALVVAVMLLILLGVGGFAVHVLWDFAVVVLIVVLVLFGIRLLTGNRRL